MYCGRLPGDVATHESIRIGRVRETVLQCNPPPFIPTCCYPRLIAAPVQPNVRTEGSRIRKEITRCPLYYSPEPQAGACPETPIYPHRQPMKGADLDEVAVVVRNRATSDYIARLREGTQTSNVALRRHGEHFRRNPPPPPCRIVQTGPQAGVPIAPTTPCILGNQRVDYSSWKA